LNYYYKCAKYQNKLINSNIQQIFHQRQVWHESSIIWSIQMRKQVTRAKFLKPCYKKTLDWKTLMTDCTKQHQSSISDWTCLHHFWYAIMFNIISTWENRAIEPLIVLWCWLVQSAISVNNGSTCVVQLIYN